jgi:hypothetical protein
MSRLNTNNIISPSTGTPILQSTGNIVQCNRVRYDSRTTWASRNNNSATEISGLRLSITPRHSGNLLLCQWVLSGDFHHDNVFVIFKNGGLITSPNSEQGYNRETGNRRWSGFISSTYDSAGSDTGSTPHHWFIQYYANAENTSNRYYSPACKSSSGSNYTLYLNRCGSSNGSNSYETTVSTGVIYEITR